MILPAGLSTAAAIENCDSPAHPPCSPQDHRKNGQIGELPKNDQKKGGCERYVIRPLRGVNIEQNDVVDDKDVSEPYERNYDECEARKMLAFGRLDAG